MLTKVRRWWADHPLTVIGSIVVMIFAIAFAVTFKEINDAQDERARDRDEVIQRIVNTGNAAIIDACRGRNDQRAGTIAFLRTFGDSARRTARDPHASPDARARAQATLADVEQTERNFKALVKLETCVGPLTADRLP